MGDGNHQKPVEVGVDRGLVQGASPVPVRLAGLDRVLFVAIGATVPRGWLSL
jgi:hypothetical protein